MGISNSTIFAAVDPISAGVLGLAFIMLVVFCVMAAKTWHWVNIVFVVLTFISGVIAIFGLTQVYHLRTEAVAEVADAEEKLNKVQDAADKQIFGDPTSLSYDPGTLRYINEALIREMAGRGRVWSRGQVALEGDLRKFTFATPRPAGPDAQSLKDVVLYAFLEQQVSDQLAPVGYIGSVRVNQESADSVTLEPVALADFQEYVKPSGSWTLFEKMPLDRRGSFMKATISFVENNSNAPADLKAFVNGLKDESREFDISGFRQILMNNFLAAQSIGFDPASRAYEELIDIYAFDGLSIGKIQNWIDQNSAGRKSTRFEPTPEEVFVKYKFNKKSNKTHQVDEYGGTVGTDGLFNQKGHAIDESLHHGKEVEFAEGDTVLVDQRTADGYQLSPDQLIPPFAANEDVTLVDRIYVRPVRDFPYEFLNLAIHTSKVQEEIQRVSKSNAMQAVSLTNAKAQIEERIRIKGDLESDKTNLENDLDTINGLDDQVTQQISELKQQVSSLESQINDTYTKLKNLTIMLSRKAFAGR